MYKLTAVRRAGGEWEHKLKLSEQTAKISVPGRADRDFFVEATVDITAGTPGKLDVGCRVRRKESGGRTIYTIDQVDSCSILIHQTGPGLPDARSARYDISDAC